MENPETKTVDVEEQDLPCFCPPAKENLFFMHPRVYLPLEEEGKARCPYCSTLYVLKNIPREMH